MNALYEKIASEAIATGYAQEIMQIEKEAADATGFVDDDVKWMGKHVSNPVKAFVKNPKAAFAPQSGEALAKDKMWQDLWYQGMKERGGQGTKQLADMAREELATNNEARKGLAVLGGTVLGVGATGAMIKNRPRKVRVVG